MVDVVVTGVGCCTAIGQNYREFSSSLFAGTSGIRSVPVFEDAGFGPSFAAAVAPPTRPAGIELRLWQSLDPTAQLGLAAAVEAIESAGLVEEDLRCPDTAVIFGCALGGANTIESAYRDFFREGATRVHPLTVPRIMSSGVVSAIVMRFGIAGPAFSISGACASSAQAIGVAKQMIQSGLIRRAIVGGAEASLTPGCWVAWQSLRVMSPRPCQPFSRERAGMTLGEGAAALVIESGDEAYQRGVDPLCRLSGVGMSSSSEHITRTDVAGPALAMHKALKDANVAASEVEYVNAHGTGTKANDMVETEALKQVFGHGAYELKISSTKAMHGHTLAAAGAIEAVASIAALRARNAPPTVNFESPDPDCDLNYVINGAQPWSGHHALSNSFGFGGLNCCLLLSSL